MRKTLFSLIALSATTVAAQPQPNVDVCKLMSVEEMQVCKTTGPGDSTGARGAYCDQITPERIDQCLEQARTAELDSASSGATAPRPEEEEKPKAAEPDPKK